MREEEEFNHGGHGVSRREEEEGGKGGKVGENTQKT